MFLFEVAYELGLTSAELTARARARGLSGLDAGTLLEPGLEAAVRAAGSTAPTGSAPAPPAASIPAVSTRVPDPVGPTPTSPPLGGPGPPGSSDRAPTASPAATTGPPPATPAPPGVPAPSRPSPVADPIPARWAGTTAPIAAAWSAAPGPGRTRPPGAVPDPVTGPGLLRSTVAIRPETGRPAVDPNRPPAPPRPPTMPRWSSPDTAGPDRAALPPPTPPAPARGAAPSASRWATATGIPMARRTIRPLPDPGAAPADPGPSVAVAVPAADERRGGRGFGLAIVIGVVALAVLLALLLVVVVPHAVGGSSDGAAHPLRGDERAASISVDTGQVTDATKFCAGAGVLVPATGLDDIDLDADRDDAAAIVATMHQRSQGDLPYLYAATNGGLRGEVTAFGSALRAANAALQLGGDDHGAVRDLVAASLPLRSAARSLC